MKVPLDTHVNLQAYTANQHSDNTPCAYMTSQQRIDTVRSSTIQSINALYSQLMHYTALHPHNTATIATPLIHGIDGGMALMAEMVTVELQAQLDCQTGQGKIDHWSFSYISNEYSTRLLHSNYSHTYIPTRAYLCCHAVSKIKQANLGMRLG